MKNLALITSSDGFESDLCTAIALASKLKVCVKIRNSRFKFYEFVFNNFNDSCYGHKVGTEVKTSVPVSNLNYPGTYFDNGFSGYDSIHCFQSVTNSKVCWSKPRFINNVNAINNFEVHQQSLTNGFLALIPVENIDVTL